MNKQKGFTIIELIVVIAIIAVLATIVLVNVTQYINKGRDAAIKGNLNTILTNASVYFDDATKGNGDYTGFTADPSYTVPATAITNANVAPVPHIDSAGSAFCVTAALKDATTFCIDSTGAKGTLVSGSCDGGTTGTHGFICN